MPEEITVIGQTNFRGEKKAFGIYTEDRRGHMYVLGKTGVGKSTLLRTMLAQDVAQGRGVALVDPHGDLASDLLNGVPPERINDVVYFDPADIEYPIGFNVLEAPRPEYKYLVASGLVGTLKKIWADSWGPRLEYILRNTILALLDYPNSTMLGISRMLSDREYRQKVIKKIEDPVVKSFWVSEFANYSDRFANEAISPIQNKIGQFLSTSVIRNIVAQSKSTIDIGEIMNEGKILIMNLSKGKLGEDNSALLGAMMITRIQLAAMDRASIPEPERKDFYLYVDEFQNFATESFAGTLSEARKYRLNLIIAHQYITQMDETVRDAVFGNVGTMVTYRVGAYDAEYLEKEFAPYFGQADIVNLDRFNAYIRLMINGVTSRPFSIQSIPPSQLPFPENKEKVIRISRERYARSRQVVEEKILRWSSGSPGIPAPTQKSKQTKRRLKIPKPTPAEPKYAGPVKPAKFSLPSQEDEITDLSLHLAKENEKRVKMYDATCSQCGKETQVPFEPEEGRPVYCPECFAIVKKNPYNAAAP